jgi:hypothetical protein
MYLEHKAKDFKKLVEADNPRYANFKASAGWLSKVLRRHNKMGVNLHGEACDVPAEEITKIMTGWLVRFHGKIDLHKIIPAWLYNADQFGLFFQKLPNRIYIDAGQKKTIAGCKQMKDKTRITVMLCTAADGSNVPLAVVGKAKKPACFSLGDPPLPYHHQANAWFDRDVTLWWILTVFWPHHMRTNGDVLEPKQLNADARIVMETKLLKRSMFNPGASLSSLC